MEKLIENKNFYSTTSQRDILLSLFEIQIIEESFFLTGGTALSVFYLFHRQSMDLDLFTLNQLELGEVDFSIKKIFQNDIKTIKASPNFISYLIREVKVDIVIDLLSNKESRKKVMLENGHYLTIDTINNIASNKFCTIVSRTEPKDFVDFYFINNSFPYIDISKLYDNARKKDAIFDDPPTVAFQIEEGINFLKNHQEIFPKILKKFDFDDFVNFYKGVINWIYNKIQFCPK